MIANNCIRRFFSAIGARHFLLLFVYFAYLSTFAFILQIIERPHHILIHRRQRLIALQQRHQFVANQILPALFNNSKFLIFLHGEKSQRMGSILLKALHKYERLSEHNCIKPEDPFGRFDRALMFAFSSASTLGSSYYFQNAVNLTKYSKLLVVGFTLVGILLTLLVVGNLATLLSQLLLKQQRILSRLCRLILCFLPKHNIRPTLNVERKNFSQSKEPSFITLLIVWSFWLYLGYLHLEHFSGIQLPFVDLVFWFVNALTTNGNYKDIVYDNPLFTYLFILYLLLGFSIMSLIFNCACMKINRLRFTSVKSPVKSKTKYDYVPKEEDQKALVARDDTFSELNEVRAFEESLIHSYHTVGIFRFESPTRITNYSNQEVGTQTESHVIQPNTRFKIPHRYSFAGNTASSHDDVQSLIRETYRPLNKAQE